MVCCVCLIERLSSDSPQTSSTSPTKSSSDHPAIRALHQTHSKKSLMAYYYAHYQQKYGEGGGAGEAAEEMGDRGMDSLRAGGSSSGGKGGGWAKKGWNGEDKGKSGSKEGGVKGPPGREEMNPLLRQASNSDDEDMYVNNTQANRRPIYTPSKGGWMNWVGADSAPPPQAGVGLGMKTSSSKGNLYGALETNDSSV